MAEFEEFPEPQGCFNEPGFVKANFRNNETYLNKCKHAHPEWAELLQNTHDKLKEIVPEYNIAQIKEKFWHLRYYIDLPEGTDPELCKKAFNIAFEAEEKAKPLK